MSTEYLPSDANAARWADSPASFLCIKASVVVAAAGTGTCNVFGPNNPNNTATASGDLSTSPAQRRSGHRLAIFKITGGDTAAASGTRTAVIFTFKTLTVASDGSTITAGGIIARANRVIGVSTAGGWGLQSSEMITPFAPIGVFPLVVADPNCGIQINVSACGDADTTMAIEILAKMLPTKIPQN